MQNHTHIEFERQTSLQAVGRLKPPVSTCNTFTSRDPYNVSKTMLQSTKRKVNFTSHIKSRPFDPSYKTQSRRYALINKS